MQEMRGVQASPGRDLMAFHQYCCRSSNAKDPNTHECIADRDKSQVLANLPQFEDSRGEP